MAGRQHEAVVAEAHGAAEQHGKDLGGGQGLSEITEALDRNHVGRTHADARRQATQGHGVENGCIAHPTVLFAYGATGA